MKRREITTKVLISRNSNDEVHIKVKDNGSRIEFLDITLTLEQYGSLISGIAELEAKTEVSGLENVGKIKVLEKRTVMCPDNIRSSDGSEWLKENCQEEGWILDTYLGTQNSISYNAGKKYLNYHVYKFVDNDE